MHFGFVKCIIGTVVSAEKDKTNSPDLIPNAAGLYSSE